MMRAPMSRMDILSNSEIKQQIENSRLFYKYNETIDRDSAYEILNEKIEKINKIEEVEERKKEAAKKAKSTSTRRSSTRMNPILKVVTSATFIRGVLGILKRVL